MLSLASLARSLLTHILSVVMTRGFLLQLFVRAHTVDGSSRSVLVDETMTVADVIDALVAKNHVTHNADWAIVERIPDLFMGES